MFRKVIFINILLVLITLLLNNTINTILMVVLIINLIIYSIKNPEIIRRIGVTNVVFLPVFLLINVIIGLLYTDNLDQGFKVLLLNIPLLLPLLIHKSNLLYTRDFERIIIIFSGFLILFISFFVIRQIGVNSFTVSIYKLNSLFAKEVIHPSYLTIYLIFSFLMLFEINFKNFNKYLVSILMLFLLVYIVLLSSKLVLIIAIYFSLKFVINFQKLHLYKKLSIISILSLTLLLFIAFPNKVKQDANNYYNLLVKKQKAKDIYSYKELDAQTPTEFWNKVNRVIIWSNSLDLIKQNLLFGVGTGDYIDELNKIYKENNQSHYLYERNMNSHNQFLDFLIKYGIIGVLIFSFLITKVFFEGITQKKQSKIIFFVVFFFFAVGENYMSRQWGVVFFSLMLPLVNIDKK